MSGSGSGGERTEKATPKRRKKARHDGQVGNTPELGAWLGLLVASFVIPHVVSSLMNTASVCLTMLGDVIRRPDIGRAMAAVGEAFRSAFLNALPLALLAAVVGCASVAAQGSLWFAPGLLKPKAKRLNPLSGIKRMFGKQGAWNLTKSLLKSVALGLVLWLSIKDLVPTIMGSGSLPLAQLVDICVDAGLRLLRFAAVAGLLMALADFVVVRKRNDKQLKMTKEEVKEEYKSNEGDPHVRSARKSRQMAMRRNRMMADVPDADVVLVNPTHVAVALKYEPSRGAPRVVAKGGDHTAARIRELADKHRIPMIADVPLARSLFASCKVGDEIPTDLYRAVATVLAFVMSLKKRGSAAGLHTVKTLAPTR
ncbi:EscU/YscU/HrcU family type III secretion system export apparatus switch protein [Jatrophihabitans fulvus]